MQIIILNTILQYAALSQDLLHLFLSGDLCLGHHLEGIQDPGLRVHCQHYLKGGKIKDD